MLCLRDGDGYKVAALLGAPDEYAEVIRREARSPGPDTGLARLARSREPVHIPDLAATPGYLAGDPLQVAAVEVFGVRSILGVPMLGEGELAGAIFMFRKEVRPFTDKQIELVGNFAAQAVIAIENARLLTELRESLDRQTATSEVLSVISSSPGELKPVFETMLANALRLCEARTGMLLRYDGDAFETEGMLGVSADLPSSSGGAHASTCRPRRIWGA